jgi:hypothetical protein
MANPRPGGARSAPARTRAAYQRPLSRYLAAPRKVTCLPHEHDPRNAGHRSKMGPHHERAIFGIHAAPGGVFVYLEHST